MLKVVPFIIINMAFRKAQSQPYPLSLGNKITHEPVKNVALLFLYFHQICLVAGDKSCLAFLSIFPTLPPGDKGIPHSLCVR